MNCLIRPYGFYTGIVVLASLLVFNLQIDPGSAAHRTDTDEHDSTTSGAPDFLGYYEIVELQKKTVETGSADIASVSPQPAGGPDRFGYTWEKRADYAWIDIVSEGNLLEFGNYDDAFTGPVPLGFNFNFYENTYNGIFVSTNGTLSFGEGTSTIARTPLPFEPSPNNLIAVLWDDLVLDPSKGNNVYAASFGSSPERYFVVQWEKAHRLLDLNAELTFQAILYEKTGNIRLQYKQLHRLTSDITIGFEDGDGLDGLLYMHDSSGLAVNDVILFKRPADGPRVKILSKYQSEFAHNNLAVFEIKIRNTSSTLTDRFNLSHSYQSLHGSSNWPIFYYAENKITPLTDTNNDGIPDTGLLSPGQTKTYYAVAKAPSGTTIGAFSSIKFTATSIINPNQKWDVELRSAVPAAFTQAFVDSDSGIGLDMVWSANRTTRPIEPWYSGGSIAITHLTNGGYFYFWERTEQNVFKQPYTDIEFSILNQHGFIRNKLKLTNDSVPSNQCYHIENINASGASAPNGWVGVVWIKNIYDSTITPGSCGPTSNTNSNVYFSMLNLDGVVQGAPLNLTNIGDFAPPGTPGAPIYYEPQISATKDNRFIVTWVEFKSYDTIYSSNIFLAALNTEGIYEKAPHSLTEGEAGNDQFDSPNLTAVDNQRAMLSYSHYDPHQEKYSIKYTILNSNGNIYKPVTSVTGSDGYKPDAIQLATGNIALTWTNLAQSEIAFAILDKTNYHVLHGPNSLANPTGRVSDYVSVAQDRYGHAILTWMDARWNTSLFYALIDGNGAVLTPSMVSYQRLGTDLIVITSEGGQGNAFYDGSVFIYMPMVVR
jgi:hypothetical protein